MMAQVCSDFSLITVNNSNNGDVVTGCEEACSDKEEIIKKLKK